MLVFRTLGRHVTLALERSIRHGRKTSSFSRRTLVLITVLRTIIHRSVQHRSNLAHRLQIPDPSFHLFTIRFTYIYSHPQLLGLCRLHRSTSLHPTLYRMCTPLLPYVFHGLCSSSLFHTCDTSQASGDMSALANMCRVGSLCMCRNEWMR